MSGPRPGPEYRFLTRWRVAGRAEEVFDLLDDVPALARWWPSVYLRVEPVRDAGGEGYRLLTRGRLPYRLRWTLRRRGGRRPHTLAIAAEGDFAGGGRWTLVQDGPDVEVAFDWRIRAEKPLLRRLSFLLRPAFAANHRWAMREGEAALRRELARRRAEGGA